MTEEDKEAQQDKVQDDNEYVIPLQLLNDWVWPVSQTEFIILSCHSV